VLPTVTSDFARVVMDVIDPAVEECEHNPPRLGADGEVEFHPAYERAGRAVWATGIVGAGAVEQASLFHLLAQAGEGGHACPVACTAGLVLALRTHASDCGSPSSPSHPCGPLEGLRLNPDWAAG
jgi:hypothetical protein